MKKKVFDYKKYFQMITEKALSDDETNRFDSYLKNVKEDKEILKKIQYETDLLKDEFKKLKWQDIRLERFYIDEQYKITYIEWNNRISALIDRIKGLLLEVSKDKQDEAYNIFYGEEYGNLRVEININYKNFNRIHIPVGLPKNFKGLGLGIKMYRRIINELGYLSSSDNNVNPYAKFVWDNLRKDTSLYTCLKDKQIISFDIEEEKEIIQQVLLDFYKNKIDNPDNQYVIDTDLIKAYPDIFENTELKKLMKN